MDLRQLHAVAAVAEHGSFSAAADALGTVQSNVSAHVARLERELGAVLIDRSNGCRLTDEGEALVVRARRIEGELGAIVDDIAALRGEVRGTVHLGMIGTTARWLVPRLLAAVGDCHPSVHLVVREGTSTSLEPALSKGDIDLAVVNLPVAGDVVTTVLFEEDLVLVVAADDPLAGAPLPLQQLAEIELVLPPQGTVFRDELERAVAQSGVRLRAKAEVDGVRTIASITFEGHGPAILPATAIPQWMQDRWVPVPVVGLPRRRVGLAQRRRGLLSAPARAVAELVGDVVAADVAAKPGVHPAT